MLTQVPMGKGIGKCETIGIKRENKLIAQSNSIFKFIQENSKIENVGTGSTNLTIVGNLLEVKAYVGQQFYGVSSNYFQLDSTAISLLANSATIVLRVLITEILSGMEKNILFESEAELKFLTLFCDINDNNYLKVKWYPGGNERIESTPMKCPMKEWFLVRCGIKNNGEDAQIQIDMKKTGEEWENQFTKTELSSQLEYQKISGKNMRIGKTFRGVINSVEITFSNGEIEFDKNALNSIPIDLFFRLS